MVDHFEGIRPEEPIFGRRIRQKEPEAVSITLIAQFECGITEHCPIV